MRNLVRMLLGVIAVSSIMFFAAHTTLAHSVVTPERGELSYKNWHTAYEPWRGDLKGLLGSFTVVRSEQENIEHPVFDTYYATRKDAHNGHHRIYWNFEITVVPKSFQVRYDSSFP